MKTGWDREARSLFIALVAFGGQDWMTTEEARKSVFEQ